MDLDTLLPTMDYQYNEILTLTDIEQLTVLDTDGLMLTANCDKFNRKYFLSKVAVDLLYRTIGHTLTNNDDIVQVIYTKRNIMSGGSEYKMAVDRMFDDVIKYYTELQYNGFDSQLYLVITEDSNSGLRKMYFSEFIKTHNEHWWFKIEVPCEMIEVIMETYVDKALLFKYNIERRFVNDGPSPTEVVSKPKRVKRIYGVSIESAVQNHEEKEEENPGNNILGPSLFKDGPSMTDRVRDLYNRSIRQLHLDPFNPFIITKGDVDKYEM